MSELFVAEAIGVLWGFISTNVPTQLVILIGVLILLEKGTKFKVLTWCFEGVGKIINKETNEKLDKVSDKVEDVKRDLVCEIDCRRRDTIYILRTDIVQASNKLRCGDQFTESMYRTLIEEKNRYDRLVEESAGTSQPIVNGVLEEDYDYIIERYHQARDNNEFM